MRITAKNIKFVKEGCMNGMTYHWFVMTTDGGVEYINWKGRKTVCEAFPKERLPKVVQKFISGRKREFFTKNEFGRDDVHSVYIYK